jgi:hypothetical protein
LPLRVPPRDTLSGQGQNCDPDQKPEARAREWCPGLLAGRASVPPGRWPLKQSIRTAAKNGQTTEQFSLAGRPLGVYVAWNRAERRRTNALLQDFYMELSGTERRSPPGRVSPRHLVGWPLPAEQFGDVRKHKNLHCLSYRDRLSVPSARESGRRRATARKGRNSSPSDFKWRAEARWPRGEPGPLDPLSTRRRSTLIEQRRC